MNEKEKCRSASLRLLTAMDRSEAELTERLAKKGFPSEAVTDTIRFLKEYGYLDDARFASHYLHYHKESKSARRIRFELNGKGVAEEYIEAAFAEYDPYDETDLIEKIIKKRLGEAEKADPRDIEKCKAYLFRQGFSMSDVRAVLRRCGLT